jgi:hypothetical protein
MPDRACPQLDWGSGMTNRNERHFKITTQGKMKSDYDPYNDSGQGAIPANNPR